MSAADASAPSVAQVAAQGGQPTGAGGPLAGVLTRARAALDGPPEPGVLRAGPAARALTCGLLVEHTRPLLVIVPTERDTEPLADAVAALLGSDAVAVFPAWETLPHERLSPQPATVGQRLRVLHRLTAGDDTLEVVIAPVRAVLQPMDPRLADRAPVRLDHRYDGGLDGLVRALAALGYARTELVDARGEFAVRGGIVDVFPTAAEHPVRVEFFGDDVDELRTFSAADQRTIGPLAAVTIDPARELVLDEETVATARLVAEQVPEVADELALLADGVAFEGMEALVTALHPAPAWLPDFLPPEGGTVLCDPTLLAQRADELAAQAGALMVAGWGALGRLTASAARPDTSAGGQAADRPEDPPAAALAGFGSWEELGTRLRGPRWELTPFAGPEHASVPASPWDSLRGDVGGLSELVGRLRRDGSLVVVSAAGRGSALRLAEVLREAGLGARVVDAVDADADGVLVVSSGLREGFRAPELGLAVLGEWDVLGPRRSTTRKRLPSRRAAAETVLDLDPGDPVVHATHGVGRYVGIVTRQLRGPTRERGGGASVVTRDFVVLEYAGGDRLYVPSDNVDAIARYVGGEQPRVMRLGGADFERAKGKVRRAVRDIAADLIRLYQARMHSEGRAFAGDTPWQHELEQAFPHVETPDQLAVIDEVKQDMAAPVPMDRLLCGDVGFGKTEIAVRAAAKAVFDGAQVAVLVPTTLLAQQHGETFTERFAGFPVEVAVLSRFTPAREVARILDGLAAGTVDLVVGTHRLLGSDVRFRDLGLLVVDEEQRFGVTHKERIKALRTSVDVLTMTATPIPRTMEMAITGIRDLSTIDTPPEQRQPVVTHVGAWDVDLAALAVRRELLREGQVFWVHNQIATIDAAATLVRELVPGVRVAVAHGQMDEAALERIMVAFWEHDYDVLVSTTIIESGLDIPNANTLVVEQADRLGLAQIYQLRGRVGRSAERGYAYLFHPAEQTLTDEAYKRLETVAELTGLGSGLSIALKDLEIRGAGSVVGADQSGHVASVGFDAYAQLMAEAIAELTDGQLTGGLGGVREPEPEFSLDLPVDAHLPTDYIADEALRLEAYRKIAGVRDAKGVTRVRDELVDRYGPLPEPAKRLLTLAALRAAARRWGVTEISATPRRTVRLAPVSLTDAGEVRLQRLRPDITVNAAAEAVELPMPRTEDLVAWLAGELKALFTGAHAPAAAPPR